MRTLPSSITLGVLSLLLICSPALKGADINDLTYDSSSDTVTITDCDTAATGSLVIPNVIEGKPVTKIATEAFARCAQLTSVTIPNSVRTIENRAFFACTSLGSITVGGDVRIIGDSAFEDCINATSITLGDNIETIGIAAFNECRSLANITIPASVTTISSGAFGGSRLLTEVRFLGDAPSFGTAVFSGTGNGSPLGIYVGAYADFPNSVEGFPITRATTPLTWGISNGEVTITDCDEAASGELVIPDIIEGKPVTSIGNYAFVACRITSITLPDSVTSIGENAFRECNRMKSAIIPSGSIGKRAFAYCSSLEDITIGNDVTSLGEAAFRDCTALTSVTILEGVTSIGLAAFYECHSLESVSIPDSVTEIGNIAFAQCRSLSSITFGSNSQLANIGGRVFYECNNLTSITISTGVTSIGENCFYSCDRLTSITFLGNAPTLGEDAFLDIPDDAIVYVIAQATGFGDTFGGLQVVRLPLLTAAPETAAADPLGSDNTFTVDALDGVAWSAESLVPWITINGGASGTGGGTISYMVDRNSGAEVRDGQIRINQDEITGGWEITTVDSEGDGGGRFPSLSFDPSGNPAISYHGNRDLKYASFDGQDWSTATIDSEGNVGGFTSLSFDPSGNPAISYYDGANRDLKFASFDGQNWSTATIDSVGTVGYDTSLSFDPLGNPAISYFDYTNDDLKYASFDGQDWNTETIDSEGRVGRYTSLSFDPSGNPAISYFDATNVDLKYASFDGQDWSTATIDSEGNVGGFTSLSFDPSGNPAISHLDVTNYDLKYASFDGQEWTTQTIDSEGIVVMYTSLSFDPSGNPAISYFEQTNTALKFASFDGQDWSTQTIDSVEFVGNQSSLSFDPSGNPAISYFEQTNEDLKFAQYSPPHPAGDPVYHTVTQPAINPNADTDGDGILDIHETGTGVFVSATDTGTDPRVADSDGDGFSDGVEVDGGSNPNNAESFPITNSAPVFADQGFTIAENSPANTVAGRLIATDAEDDALTFTILPPNSQTFRIAGDRLLVRNPAALDYETNSTLTLRARASDGEFSDNATITVSLVDVRTEDCDGDGLTEAEEEDLHGTDDCNPDSDGDGFGDKEEVDAQTDPTNPNSSPNKPPVFADRSLFLADAAQEGAVVGTILATDPNNDALEFKIIGNVDTDLDGEQAFRIEDDKLILNDAGDLKYQFREVTISSGWYHDLAINAEGKVIAWGRNDEGQCNVPSELGVVRAIAAGFYHSLALQEDGSVVAWGDNRYGQTDVPTRAQTGVVAIATDGYHNLALRIDGSLVVWGRNHLGQLRNLPNAPQEGPRKIEAIAAGAHHNLVLRADATVDASGYNQNGQTNLPASWASVIDIEGGALHSVALREDGTIVVRGSNARNERNVPELDPENKIVDISSVGYHNLGLREDGTVIAWGYNNRGQINVPPVLASADHPDFVPVTGISAGGYHSLVLREDGSLIEWGLFAIPSDQRIAQPQRDSLAVRIVANDGQASTTATYTINIGPDTDGDGLLDSAETNTGTFVSENETGTDPANPDSDGDGFNDGVEVAAGSDPNDADSTPEGNASAPFTLSFSTTRLPSGAIDQITVSFPTRNGRSYRIEESTDFRTWRTRESGINGNGETIQRSLPAAGRKMLLRASEE